MGTKVIDPDGKSLGTIDYVVRDTWSGDVKKLMIYRKPPEEDLSFSPDDTSEITEDVVKLSITIP